MQNLSNKQGSFTAFSYITSLVRMPPSVVSYNRKPRQYQNHNTPLALKGVDMKCKCKWKEQVEALGRHLQFSGTLEVEKMVNMTSKNVVTAGHQ